jgi:hypothetical protein
MSASSTSQPRVTFAASTDAADTSSGFPQVSILNLKKQKDILKKRREALIAGKGKSYPGIGTHRRSTTKHTWTYGELAELSATFMMHYNLKPLWKIAQEIHASFVTQLQHQEQQQAAAAAAIDSQEEQVAQLREPRTHLPTVTAIELKLMDCTSLHFNDTHNYISKPSQMHHEVWSHLLRAQKHRTMIRSMTATKPEPQEQEQHEQPEQQKQDQEREIWNVHAREFMYDSVAEYEEAFPPAKRRKLNPNTEDDEQIVVGEIEMEDNTASNTNDDGMNMGEICEALEEIANQINEREHNRQSTYIAVNESLAQIQAREQQIANLLTTLRDTTSEIETHRQEITREMERIRAIVDPAPPAYSAPSSAQQAQAAFDPNHYQCRECAQMFNPLMLGYWLIGPNRETGDTFYLCRECTKFMDDTPQTQTTSQRIDEEEGDQDQHQHQHQHQDQDQHQHQDQDQDQGCGGGDCDCWDDDSDGEWEDCEEEYQNGGYDHGEECS